MLLLQFGRLKALRPIFYRLLSASVQVGTHLLKKWLVVGKRTSWTSRLAEWQVVENLWPFRSSLLAYPTSVDSPLVVPMTCSLLVLVLAGSK